MKRREFTKSVAFSTLGISFLGCGTVTKEAITSQSKFPVEELLGRTQPALFGDAQLRKEANDAFEKMKTAAAKEGIQIQVVSSYRSYQRQEQIWNGKYDRFTKQGLSPIQAIEKIIEYSTIPGTSRHHWGTELDIIQAGKPKQEDSLLARHFEEGGLYRELKIWLDENKAKFGFYEVYTNEPDRKGFKYEPWHLSYRPISHPMLQDYKKIDLKALLQKIKLKGSEHFTDEFIARYRAENVLDINPKLL